MGFWSNIKNKFKERKEKKKIQSAFNFSSDIKKLSKKYNKYDEDFIDELEEILIKTDMGMNMVLKVSDKVRKYFKKGYDMKQIKEIVTDSLYDSYINKDNKKTYEINYQENRLNIFLFIGVNGVGKTTSLSKIANYYSNLNKKVMIAAADTFRAGATEQLEEWLNNRLDNKNISLVKTKKPNQDPSSVIYDALEKAEKDKTDILLIDTAGRLQNKVNLMNELEKMHKIIKKFSKYAPHEVLLVIDATTGQNGIQQAKEFKEITNLTGIILTKMDGTSKGGVALAIKDQLNIPVKFIGIGEQVNDIVNFDPEEYIYSLVEDFIKDDE